MFTPEIQMLELRETFLMPPIDTEALALSELSADLNPQPGISIDAKHHSGIASLLLAKFHCHSSYISGYDRLVQKSCFS